VNSEEKPAKKSMISEETAEKCIDSAENYSKPSEHAMILFDSGDLRRLSVPQLISLRHKVLEALPAASLAQMNLEQEVVLLFLSSKALFDDVLGDDEVPTNQKAQVANSCSANLQQLVKMQLDLYTTERIKAIEAALTKTLKTLPIEAQQKFFEEYEKSYAMLAPKAKQESLPG
jgi:hypothetical protein